MSYIIAPKNRPLRLRSDNFTPPSRTPWGGTRIVERYKPSLVGEATSAAMGEASAIRVGESWELGVEPDFPTRVSDGRTLAEIIADDPEGLVGDEGASTALLVKLLDAAEPLSVQIHPADDDPALAADESGKPESWYVLDADPGAGLYLAIHIGSPSRCQRA